MATAQRKLRVLSFSLTQQLILYLDISHLDDVIDTLKKSGFGEVDWFQLGLKLGLLYNTLQAIETNCRVTDRCLLECLSKWLQKADNVVRKGGPPSWNSLSNALRAINKIFVADKLDKFKRLGTIILNDCHDQLTQTSIDVLEIAKMLHGEGVISDAVLCNVTSAEKSVERRKKLFAAVWETVQINCLHLQVFASVLMRFPDTVLLGEYIYKKYEELYGRWENDATKTSQREASDHGSSSGVSSSPQTPETPLPTSINDIKIPINKEMKSSFHSIRSSFGDMINKIRDILSINTPLVKLKLYLEDRFPDLRPQLTHANDMKDVVRLIEGECTLIDIQPLHVVINRFTTEEAKRHLKEYEVKMEEFCKSITIKLCLKERFEIFCKAPYLLHFEMATYVFDWEPGAYMLNDIISILSKASGKLVNIKYIKTGQSICVTCTFSYSLFEVVIIKSLENLDMLKKNGLMELTVGYITIWKKEVQSEMSKSCTKRDTVTVINKIKIDEQGNYEYLTEASPISNKKHCYFSSSDISLVPTSKPRDQLILLEIKYLFCHPKSIPVTSTQRLTRKYTKQSISHSLSATRRRSTPSSTRHSLVLDVSDLDEVIDTLRKCGFNEANWIKLGLKLGLFDTTLKAIENRYHLNGHCLLECLSKWLQKADNVLTKGGPPSWGLLSKALDAINEINVADKLNKLKCFAIGIFNDNYIALTETRLDIFNVTELLHKEKVISDATLSSVKSTAGTAEQRNVLLCGVREAIQINYLHLQTFASVLMKFTNTVRFGKHIHKAYNRLYERATTQEILITQRSSCEFRSIRTSYEKMLSTIQNIF